VDYISFDSIPHYSECAPLVEGLGYRLVELRIVPAKTVTKISAVITAKDPEKNIGVDDCAKVHHALQPRLQALLKTEDTAMELTSPGIDRNIKNAAEFELFTGRTVRVWSRTENDWIGGRITGADEKSVTLETESGVRTIGYDEIAKAKFIQIQG
jgi:ribosome maturation factor RimP